MKRAVFLDRDGVLNEAIVRAGKPFSPNSVEAMVVVSDAASALSALKKSGFQLFIVTNQPDIARGKLTRDTVDAMNAYLSRGLPLDGIEVCEHDDIDRCTCRKPAPGMLLRAAAREGIDLSSSFIIGDSWRDIEAGRRAGCRAILVGDGYGEGMKAGPDVQVDCLTAAADWILLQPLRKVD